MKVRVKFSKQGEMRFIGHLDLQRFFQKAFRRAGIDVCYSEGMSPHMIMSFASPLGVGLTSDGEYIDMELNCAESAQVMKDKINAILPEGLRILSIRQIEEGKAGKAMSLVAAADYRICFRPGYEPVFADRRAEDPYGIAAFAGQEHIMIRKVSKKALKKKEGKGKNRKKQVPPETSEDEVRIAEAAEKTERAGEKTNHTEVSEAAELTDLRPLVYELRPEGDTIFLKCSAGSNANVKPETVMEAFLQWKNMKLQPFSLLINRLEMYADKGDGSTHRFVTLEDLGTEF